VKEITNIISTLRRKIIAINRVQAVAICVTIFAIALGTASIIDYLVHWPWAVRLFILIFLILILVKMFQGWFKTQWNQKPTNASVAIRLEEIETTLGGLLASAVDFEAQNNFEQDPLAIEVKKRAKIGLDKIRIHKHIYKRPAIFATMAALSILAAWLCMIFYLPQITIIALQRTLLPWIQTEWPPRLFIHSEISKTYAAKGETILLRAKADENQTKEMGVRVQAICEIKDKHGSVLIKSFEMVEQSDGAWEKTFVAEGETLSVSFVTDQFKTSPNLIHVVEPPEIQNAKLSINPPNYAAQFREKTEIKWEGGTMPTLPAVLAGASAELEINLSNSLDPKRNDKGEIDAGWMSSTIRAADISTNNPQENFDFAFKLNSPTQWLISWNLNEGIDLFVDPCDENGIHGREPLRAQIQVVSDQAPTVVVVEPEQDEVVTKIASIPTIVQAKDDLVLASVGLQLDRQQRSGEPQPQSIQSKEIVVDLKEGEFKSTLELRPMELKSGDTLLLRGTARDLYEIDGQKRANTTSEPRLIHIVDQDVFEKKIHQQTSNLRQVIARIETSQKEAIDEKDNANKAQSQKSLSDRISQAQQTAERITKRLNRNGMKDSNITEAMTEVDQQASIASKHSQNASQELRQGSEGNKEAIHKATQEQNEALQAIQAMLNVIDQDDESVGAQQRTDKLAETISKLRKDLGEIANKTAGKNTEELSTEEQTQLHGQAEKQRTAAQEARALIEDLQERAQRTKKNDKGLSEALQSAIKEAQKGDAEKNMEEAADRSDKNQTGAADDSMQAAAEAVEKIQNALKADRQAKKDELKRKLSSLVETIRGLVTQAETARGLLDIYDRSIKSIQTETEKKCELLARNIVAAAEETKGGGREAEPVTKILEKASGFQDSVVEALRNTQPKIDPAKEASSRALELLKEALFKTEAIQKNQNEQELEKEKDELAQKYTACAALEKLIRKEVARILPPDQRELDRRAVATSREMSERQETLRARVAEVLKTTEIIKNAPVFVKTHELIDGWMKVSREQMKESNPTPETIALMDFTTESLEGLAAALADPEQKDEPFSNNNTDTGGGGGEGGASQKKKIPPIAELRLVRELQAQINRRTKLIEETNIHSPQATKAIGDLSKLQENVRMLGEDWIERMKKMSSQDGLAPETPDQKEPERAPQVRLFPRNNKYLLSFSKSGDLYQVPQTTQPPPTTETSKQIPPTNPPAKTLDELLGIGGSGGEKAAEAQRNENLSRELQENSLQDLAKAAMADMKIAQQLVDKDHDLGIGTQRVQAQALSRLDALIEAAVKFEKSATGKPQKNKNKKDSSGSGVKKKPGSDENEADGKPNNKENGSDKNGDTNEKQDSKRNNNGAPGDEINPPEFVDAQLQDDSNMDESRSEWGHLPQRIREIMAQSRRDRISALYQKATEAYYRRMAEDRGP